MSSLFTESERQLATLGLAPLEGELDVVIGGLGLGYTAAEALKNRRSNRLLVIDLFQAVIDWHQAGLVPNGECSPMTPDASCGKAIFSNLPAPALIASAPDRKFDAVLLDIDHSPEHFLGRQQVLLHRRRPRRRPKPTKTQRHLSPSGPTTRPAKTSPPTSRSIRLRSRPQHRVSKPVHRLNIGQFRLRRTNKVVG